jgi:arsenite-transporting ATPase
MAHNLSDLFQQHLGRDETMVAPNLYALEIDPAYVMEHDYQDIMDAIVKFLASERFHNNETEFDLMLPGMEELFSLLKIMNIYENSDYERIIVDCAPTGETLSLLKFPELLSWYMEKFFPLEKFAMRILAPISKRAFKVELPDQKAMNEVEKLYLKLLSLQNLLKNRAVASIRLVTIPEKMVVEETKRNYMYMNLFNYPVDGVYINRILPVDINQPFFTEWIRLQDKYMQELQALFTEIPVYRVPWYDTDLNGMDGIDRIVTDVLASRDVFAIHPEIASERYEKIENGYMLYIPLPVVVKEKVNMHMSGTDVIIKIGNFKRSIPVPNTLRAYKLMNAKLADGELAIRFDERSESL